MNQLKKLNLSEKMETEKKEFENLKEYLGYISDESYLSDGSMYCIPYGIWQDFKKFCLEKDKNI